MSLSPLQALAKEPPEVQARWLAQQEPWALEEMARREWWWVGRPEQQRPPGNWFVWLIMTGRGWGKTQTGAEWIADRAIRYPADVLGRPTEHLLIAETLNDALLQCLKGPAGLLTVLERLLGPEQRHQHDGTGRWRLWKAPKPVVRFRETEVSIIIEGADNEDVGRGYNATSAWMDEFAKWPKPDGSWTEGIMPSLRTNIPGDFPRALVTTTPKPVVQLIEWKNRTDGSVHLTTGSTYDNAANLAPPVLAELFKRYTGTRLGRQELEGELLEEVEGALWNPDMFQHVAYERLPQTRGRVVAMDAAGNDERTSAETGLVAAGVGEDGLYYVLGDWSKRIVGMPAARRAWEMYLTFNADVLVYEDNQGKAWLRAVLVAAWDELVEAGRAAGSPPLRAVTAKAAKRLRAEPVAGMYEQGRVVHALAPVNPLGYPRMGVGGLADLETQQITWVPEKPGDSPDRVDAAVYCLLWLDGRRSRPADVANPARAHLPRTTALATGLPGPYG